MLVLLAMLAFQIEPRFTMSTEPGDRFAAEVYRFQDGVTADSVDGLVGSAVRSDERIESLPEGLRVRIISAVGATGERRVLLAPVDAPADRNHHVCRLSQRPEGVVDNVTRALSWCLSFMGGPAAAVEVRGPDQTR